MRIRKPRSMPRARAVAAVLALTALAGQLAAQERPVPDSFEATTTGMQPDGLKLKADILKWSDADSAADVIAALESSDDVAKALADLPSLGVVWRNGSAVGHSIKYARREKTDDGGERITIVTDKPLDAYSFKPWMVTGEQAHDPLPYAVIELDLGPGGSGAGNLSLAADVDIDAAAGRIALADGGPVVLADAKALPKPYWEQH